jgi:hypothetical protein
MAIHGWPRTVWPGWVVAPAFDFYQDLQGVQAIGRQGRSTPVGLFHPQQAPARRRPDVAEMQQVGRRPEPARERLWRPR